MRYLADLIVIAVLWTADFVILNRTGTWLPVTATAIVLAGYFLWREPALRQMLVPNLRSIAVGLCGAAVMIAVTYLGFAAVAPRWPAFASATVGLYDLLDSRHYGHLPLTLLLVPTTLGEEVIFRGRVLGPRRHTRLAALAVWLGTGVIYGAMHVGSNNLTLVGIAFLCGLYWSALRLWSKSLIPSMLTHALWDLAILVVHPLVLQSVPGTS